ncbi:MAG: arginine--tRNA ligase [Bdellovibrionaceae bacterium]|nr:arginine--tRNA ligase [Pseudobdellovibrionaceae bacterium]MDW8190173.1 arginine--tRNA ligase [Pseudobdellovibrionaceae bacterium]
MSLKIAYDRPFVECAHRVYKALHALSSQGNNQLNVTLEEVCALLTMPPQLEWGDFAIGCFPWAKPLGIKPNEIAVKLADDLRNDSAFSQVEASGPYLNLRLSYQAHQEYWLKDLLAGDYFQAPLVSSAPKTMIEFSQPNTHKELHVGHMRNACLGDALVRLQRYCGVPVISATFPGDIGMHVAKCLWYLRDHNQEPIPETGRGEWLGRLYSKAHLKLEDEVDEPRASHYRQRLTYILRQLENKDGEFYELWKETRQWSIDLMNRIYSWLGISFDVWYWESEVDEPSRQYVKQLLQEGKLIESQGAVGMDLSDVNLGFCMLLKSDGTGLYATKDLELARRKFQDYHIERSVYVVDMRQALHFAQVFKVLERLGFEQAKNCVHLQYNFVELPDGAMSSRKGNIVPITVLVERMEETIKERYLSRYKDEWTQDEIQRVAHQVAVGAIKYGMLKIDTQKKIVFHLDEWLRLDGDSGPFIQYSVARIKSLLRKAELEKKATSPNDTQKFSTFDCVETINWGLLQKTEERQLLTRALFFRTTVRQAALQEKPHLLTRYLYELAQSFNLFYHQCPILSEENHDLSLARLALSRVVGLVLEKGLNLLGIPSPERM